MVVLKRRVKKFGSGCHLIISKKFLDKDAIIIIDSTKEVEDFLKAIGEKNV